MQINNVKSKRPRTKQKKAHPWYFHKAWRARKEKHLRDNPNCVACAKKGMSFETGSYQERRVRGVLKKVWVRNQVDHIERWQDQPTQQLRWLSFISGKLQTLCAGCHMKKTMNE